MKNLKKEFPTTAKYTYLNTAASGLLSKTVLEFRQNHDLEFLAEGSVLKDKQGDLITSVREAVGSFFNCNSARVALTPNFSYGFNALLEGLPKMNKVLLISNDYPSINWAVEGRDFPVCYADLNEHLEENIRNAVVKHNPDVFVFSLVQYINGIKIDQAFLKELKREFPQLLIIADGTQYCGIEPFSFKNSAIDILGASAYKWLNAAYGNAFFMFKEGVEERIFPKNLGFGSKMGKYKADKDSLIGKLEPGHLDTLNFGSLRTALELINQIGPSDIYNQVQTLSTKAFQAFSERNLLEDAIIRRKNHSSLFNIKGDDVLFSKLTKSDIICSQRGDGIRVSFHYYNTNEDLNKILSILDY